MHIPFIFAAKRTTCKILNMTEVNTNDTYHENNDETEVEIFRKPRFVYITSKGGKKSVI